MKIQLSTNVSALLLSIILCLPVLAQQQTPQANQPEESKYVTSTGFRNKIFEVKHRAPRELYSAISTLTSGFKGAQISYSDQLRTITVRDFPENIATIEEAIKRLDVPSAARPAEPDIEAVIHVLIASNDDTPDVAAPGELQAVIKQLRSTLNYKNYQLLTSIVHRAKLVPDAISPNITIQGNGSAALKIAPGKTSNPNYSYQIRQISPEGGETGSLRLSVRDLYFNLLAQSSDPLLALGEAKISTSLSLREGEKVVVGTASLKDKGLILVLTAKVIK